MGVKNARAAVKYDGLTMDRECVSFFASYYKTIYMSALSKPTLFSEGVKNVSDTRYFWESVSESGETYGELLESGVETYIKQMMVAVYLYDNYASVSA